MNKLLTTFLAVVFTALCLTGCLSSNDNTQSNYHFLTASDRSAAINAMAGSFEGYTKYYSTATKIDSAATSWEIRKDTTMLLKFPVRILADYYTMESDSLVRNALATASDIQIPMKIYFPNYILTDSYSSWKNGFAEVMIIPTMNSLQFQAGTYSFKLELYPDDYYSYLTYNYNTYNPILQYLSSRSQAYLLLKQISYDGKSAKTLNIPTMFYGTKK